MKTIKLLATILAISLFLMACNQQQPQQVATDDPYVIDTKAPPTEELPLEEDVFMAKDNLDLQRVGNLLERSNSPREFETYLNSNDGINNLDLNDDGYVDYISVDEYQDRDDYSRGLSLYASYGINERQELGTVVFYRDDFNAPGARILVTGNQQIYGDNYYYETNWVDRTIGIVSALFSPRTVYYQSPYYYDNYPSGYQAYRTVEMPYYRTRIESLYPQPMFVYTTSPTFYSKIKIKSPNNGLHLGWTKARFVNPTKEQAKFYKTYRRDPRGIRVDQGGKHNDQRGKSEVQGGKKDNPSKASDRPNQAPKMQRETGKPSNPGNDKQVGKPQKSDQGGKGNDGKGQGKGKEKP